jgi:hypothetical protein
VDRRGGGRNLFQRDCCASVPIRSILLDGPSSALKFETAGEARGGGGLGKAEMEMTEKPWCLADLMFEPMGDDLREKATINGVEIVREDGRYWIRTENGPHYDNLAEDGVELPV